MEKTLHCFNKRKITILGLDSVFTKLTSFLLKQSPHVNRLALYNDRDTSIPYDVANINTQCKIRAYIGQDQLHFAVKNADIVLIGDQQDVSTLVPHHKRNLRIESRKLLEYACAIAEVAPSAIILVAATPVNSLLPLMSEFLIKRGAYDSNKVLGVTAIDNVRANKLAADFLKTDPRQVVLPVIGGSSPDTRVPLFSQSRPCLNLSRKNWLSLTWDIKNTETVIQRSKGTAESVNKAYATVRFVHSVLAGLRGDPNIAEIALARTILVPDTPYFALPVILGQDGISYRFNLPALTKNETFLVEHAAKCMNRDAEAGLKYLGSTYFKVNPKSESRGLVSSLFKKIAGVDQMDVTKKPEYFLLTNKQTPDLNPTFKPSVQPVAIPFVENDDCPNGNKHCAPVQLPEPPSKPRRTTPVPPNLNELNREMPKVSTPFAPVENVGSTIPFTPLSRKNESQYNVRNLEDPSILYNVAHEKKKIKIQELVLKLKKREIARRLKLQRLRSTMALANNINECNGKKKEVTDQNQNNGDKNGNESSGKMSEEVENLCKRNKARICKGKVPKSLEKNISIEKIKTGEPVKNNNDSIKFIPIEKTCPENMEKQKLAETEPPVKPIPSGAQVKKEELKLPKTELVNVLSKQKNLLNDTSQELKVGKRKEPRLKLFSKCISFIKKDLKHKSKPETVEANEKKQETDNKNSLAQIMCTKLNSILKGESSKKHKPCSLNENSNNFSSKENKSESTSTSQPLPPVLTEENVKLQEKIDRQLKNKSSTLSKVYAPKCPSHFLHSQYPDYSHIGKSPKEFEESKSKMEKDQEITNNSYFKIEETFKFKNLGTFHPHKPKLSQPEQRDMSSSPASSQVNQADYSRSLEALSKISPRECHDCQLCKKLSEKRAKEHFQH